MIKASRHTLFANIVQQFCAGLLLLFLPNILGKADYAQVVFVMVLLSFVAFADAGMSMAYGRVVPSLLAQNKHDEVKIWDSTTLRFGLAMSCFCSVIMTIIYYHRYGNLINTLLLLPMPFVVFWFSFHVSRFSTFGNFSCYSKVNTWRSIGSLLVFPLAFTFGLTGFFISQLVAALLALASIGKILFKPLGKLHWSLLRHHLLEGVIRSLTGILWINLMNFSRLYASIKYGAEDIATYGIMSSAAQSLLSLVISLFLPVGVELFNRHGKSELHALEFAHHIIRRSIKWTMPVPYTHLTLPTNREV